MLGAESIKLLTRGIQGASEISLMPSAEKGLEKESRSGGKLGVLVWACNTEILLIYFPCHLHMATPVRHQNGCRVTSML